MIPVLLKAKALLSKIPLKSIPWILVAGLIGVLYLQDKKIAEYRTGISLLNERIIELEANRKVLNNALFQSNEETAKEAKRLAKIREESAVLRGVIQEIRHNNRQAIKTIMDAPTPQTAEAAMTLLRQSLEMIKFNSQ